jgi:cytoskeletal protein CcmA (bactofilin family)
MFKKDPNETSPPQPRAVQSGVTARTSPPRTSAGSAIIGPSITIKGDVSGDEDLMIQGRIDGKVNLAKHNVTIGSEGRVKADVQARTVVVEGEVEGDLRAQEQIILRHTAKVEGSITAPRVVLEDGAVFRGGIEMDAGKGTATGISKPQAAGRDAAADREPSDTDKKAAAADEGKGKSLQA